ncbi:M48 family metallopeptidase [Pseudomaricurvus alcaniphilus]|uniref:M48 family metallopeptidase n=1 Tax=Pseudomaricurvus alcaniphilus TaxID=1166482 RepID=UPI00140CE585|nr:M48 family metallopeptidase [Pseudomaricurvus alcaniphilus]NHN39645.1 M48 family metallopeptidase [Pseudomaricurvus alcaniphilus]
MDFFQHQDQARKNSRRLLVFFLAAVLALIAITTFFISAVLYYLDGNSGLGHTASAGRQPGGLEQMFNWELSGMIALVVVFIVAVGSGYRLLQLRAGGDSIAAALGGRRLQPNSATPSERRLLNVVEEMAIASGTPVPSVYLLEESGINAFAAGHSSSNAVIGITRGCMELLDRDQLQGVIAHEFSHILHGDMKLNLRLLGVLHGILLIGLLGSMLLRASSGRRSYGMRRRDKNSSGLALVGLGLVVIGYAGTFLGKLIKAALSRQREFLADAAAVQFTRNPRGISEALQAIGGYSQGSRLSHPQAEEFSHMYFGAGVRTALGGMLATHPPLAERIHRITPGWNGRYPEIKLAASATATAAAGNTHSATDSGLAAGITASSTSTASATDTNGAASGNSESGADLTHIANPGAQHLDRAASLLSQLPDPLRQAAREPFSARAIIYNLLLQPDAGDTAARQWQQLQQRAHPAVVKLTRQLHSQVTDLPRPTRLPLFELTLPALRTLSAPQYRVFKTNVAALIKADREVAVFEWALYRMLVNALEPAPRQSGSNTDLRQLGVPIQQLLSSLCHSDQQQQETVAAAYSAGMSQLGLTNLPLLDRNRITLPLLDAAIKQLQALKPLQKPALLKALLVCIRHDQQITAAEYELFRAVADCLDCPVPPLLER